MDNKIELNNKMIASINLTAEFKNEMAMQNKLLSDMKNTLNLQADANAKAVGGIAKSISSLDQNMKAGRDVNNTTNSDRTFEILSYTSLTINLLLTGIIAMVIKLLFSALNSKNKYKLNYFEYEKLKQNKKNEV